MFTIRLLTFNPVQENTYIVSNGSNECCIVDPGCYYQQERNELKDFILGSGLRPKYLLNTHCHLDHVFGNRFIHETFHLPLYLHKDEKPVLDFAPASGEMWGMPFENYEGPLHYLAEGDRIELGTDILEVLFTPGHSPGSISFFCREQNFVLSGDVLFRQGIGRTDLPGGNFNTLVNSIKNKLFVLPDEVIVYPGHGPSTTIGFEKANNPFIEQ